MAFSVTNGRILLAFPNSQRVISQKEVFLLRRVGRHTLKTSLTRPSRAVCVEHVEVELVYFICKFEAVRRKQSTGSPTGLLLSITATVFGSLRTDSAHFM